MKRSAGPRKKAHEWIEGFSYRGKPIDPSTVTYEWAQDRLDRSWTCSKCSHTVTAAKRPSRYKKVYAPGAGDLLCDDYAVWKVMES